MKFTLSILNIAKPRSHVCPSCLSLDTRCQHRDLCFLAAEWRKLQRKIYDWVASSRQLNVTILWAGHQGSPRCTVLYCTVLYWPPGVTTLTRSTGHFQYSVCYNISNMSPLTPAGSIWRLKEDFYPFCFCSTLYPSTTALYVLISSSCCSFMYLLFADWPE